jgi:Asp-tRNA(Asn)/Glu-tRNA(Gln) amidotransferase A subunit family amidase
MGLTSRAGVVPLSLLADIAGPMTRTVEDAVAVFQAIVGEDPDDPATVASRGRTVPDYRQSLQTAGLKGARIGILRQAYERDTADAEVVDVFMAAVDDLQRAGAEVIDPVRVDLTNVRRAQDAHVCGGFKYDINRYLAAQGDRVKVHSLEEIIRSRAFHPSIEARLRSAQDGDENGPNTTSCAADADYREAFRGAVAKTMDAEKLDAFVYPTWSNPPRLIGDLNTPHGDNSQVFSPTTGWPAINVPMGYTRGTLPIGLTFFGRAWSEPTLIAYAYAYEQATRHRRPPASTPPLRETAK